MYKLFLCFRYLMHRRIAIVPILAVMLCVAMDLIVASLMGGFVDKVRGAVRGLFGDVIITKHSMSGFGYYDTYKDAENNKHPGLLQYLDKLSANPTATAPKQDGPAGPDRPIIRQATPVIETGAMLGLPNRRGWSAPVRVLGIVPDEYAAVTDFQRTLYWQKPGPGGPVAVKDESGRPSRWLEKVRQHRDKLRWQGSPRFDRVPDLEDGPPCPLAEVAKDQKGQPLSSPLGTIVGARVFWPTPDPQGHYPRQDLLPGTEPVLLTFLPLTARGGFTESVPTRLFHLVDNSLSQIQQIDERIAYVPFASLQEFLDMGPSEAPVDGFLAPARTSRILIKLADGVPLKEGRQAVQQVVDQWVNDRWEQFRRQPPAVQDRMAPHEPFVVGPDMEIIARPDVLIWEEANKDYFSAIENQRFIALLMVGVVSLTVVALIWVIFIMIVVEKTKDIGIIKSVGGSAGGVTMIFLAWSAVIGLIGSVLGGLLGSLFIDYINPIEQWLSRQLGTKLFDPRAYLFDSIPARFKWAEMIWIGSAAVAAAMLGALLPALRAGRMNPVDALRYE